MPATDVQDSIVNLTSKLKENDSSISDALSDVIIKIKSTHALELFALNNHEEKATSVDQLGNGLKINSIFIQLFEELYFSAKLKNAMGRDDGYYGEDDFQCTSLIASKIMDLFGLFLEKVSDIKEFDINELVNVIVLKSLLISLQHVELKHAEQPWTSKESNVSAKQLFQKIFEFYGCQSESELLCSKLPYGNVKSSLFFTVWKEFESHLKKTTWKSNPDVKCSFVTCLFKMKFPFTGDYLEYILPISLMLIDDFQVENKILGVQCVSHIISNVSKAEMLRYGRAEVVYKAVQQQLYVTKDITLLDESLSCMLQILNVVEQKRLTEKSCETVSCSDDVLTNILKNMEMENILINRRVYAKYISKYIDQMGLEIVKHFSRLLRVIYTFLEIPDGAHEETRLDVLDALKVVMVSAWPRIPPHTADICKHLLKLLYDITEKTMSSESDPVKHLMVEKITECMVLLKHISPDETTCSLEVMLDVKILNEQMMAVISDLSILDITQQ